MGANFLSQMFKPIKSATKWVVHAAEDTFNFGKKTVSNVVNLGEKTVNGGVRLVKQGVSGGVRVIGKAGDRVLGFADNQTSKMKDVLMNPTFMIVAGCVVVAIILLK